jgi:hypothetical protein
MENNLYVRNDLITNSLIRNGGFSILRDSNSVNNLSNLTLNNFIQSLNIKQQSVYTKIFYLQEFKFNMLNI